MKKLFTLLILIFSISSLQAETILDESFEYGNNELQPPIGWISHDNLWLCSHLDMESGRVPHTGEWYAFTTASDTWMFMPIGLNAGNHYQIDLWANTESSATMEIVIASAPEPRSVIESFLPSTLITGNGYQNCSAYLECNLNGDFYLGIHAIETNDSPFVIDDILLQMFYQYEFTVNSLSHDTVMYYGDEGHFAFSITNTGFDTERVSLSASHEYFPHSVFYDEEGSAITALNISPNTTTIVNVIADLSDELDSGSDRVWLDVSIQSNHNCHTGLATFWVVPMMPETASPISCGFESYDCLYGPWWIMKAEGKTEWEWVANGENPSCTPYDNSQGMLMFRSEGAEVGDRSLLVSPKFITAPDNNVSLQFYRTAAGEDHDAFIRIYFCENLWDLENAQIIGTLYQSTSIDPQAEESGWYEFSEAFTTEAESGFIVIEASSATLNGQQECNMFLDEVRINDPTWCIKETDACAILYPNPAHDELFILSDCLQEASLYDMNGKCVLTTQENRMNLKSIRPGVYLIRLKTKAYQITRKIIIR